MIDDIYYKNYLSALLAGKRSECREMVQQLVDAHIPVKMLYTDLFQRSLYRVGELWETNQITVANEHLATSITESLLNLVYPSIFSTERTGKTALISCGANEFHQVGGKMVADILELNGWDGHFLGANTSPEELLEQIQEIQPDFVGLSLSIISNIDHLKRNIEAVKSDFPNLDVWVGGQAFRWGGTDIPKKYAATELIPNLDELEKIIHQG